MTITIRPVSTIELIGLSETNTIGYYNFLLAACQPPSALAAARAHPRQRLGQALAAADTRDGRGADRPCVDPARSAALPRAAVAAASRGVRKREQKRERRVAVS